jgi:hypothetical protein
MSDVGGGHRNLCLSFLRRFPEWEDESISGSAESPWGRNSVKAADLGLPERPSGHDSLSTERCNRRM